MEYRQPFAGPPLCLTEKEADIVVDALKRSVAEVFA
jgi:hypothetical protein